MGEGVALFGRFRWRQISGNNRHLSRDLHNCENGGFSHFS